LGGLPSVGINCASCHVARITSTASKKPSKEFIQILGVTSHFDVEAFFNSVIIATFKTADPVNMKKFLGHYLTENDLGTDLRKFEAAWRKQEPKIIETLKDDPFGANGIASGEL